MKSSRAPFFGVSAFLMLIASALILGENARACQDGASGPQSFIAAPGSSQTLNWKAYCDLGPDIVDISVSGGSGLFSVSQMPMSFTDSGTFTVTFAPGPNDTGTYKATLACPCGRTYEIVGTVASSVVSSAVPSAVSFTASPNPAMAHLTLATTGVRSATIGIYDLLGNEIASSRATRWEFDASGIPPGTYIVHISGASFSGDPFVESRKIVIAR